MPLIRAARTTGPARLGVIASTVALVGGVLFLRVHDVDQSFAMLGEQIRDWSVARRPFLDLPLAGPRSLNSGADIGPAYYWTLWLIRRVAQPFVGAFPHAGGWGISLLLTTADCVLLVALNRRLGSWPIAASIVLLTATSPFDLGLSAVVWNPPLAGVFAKLATAALLWRDRLSTSTSAIAIACAWLAVQMHISAIVVALPVTVWVAYAAGVAHDHKRYLILAAVLTISVAGVMLPYAFRPLDRLNPHGIAASLGDVVANPLARVRPLTSAAAVGSAIDRHLLHPWSRGWLPLLLIAGGLVVIGRIRVAALTAASVGVLATAVAVFSLSQGPLTELYWFTVTSPAGAVCAVAPISVLNARWRRRVGGGLLLLIIAVAPYRARIAWTEYRLPQYGPLLVGVRAAASGRPVRDVEAGFAVPQGMDPRFLFDIAGGRFDAATSEIAVIQADGSISYRRAP